MSPPIRAEAQDPTNHSLAAPPPTGGPGAPPGYCTSLSEEFRLLLERAVEVSLASASRGK